MSKFKVGDRVRVVKSSWKSGALNGKSGIVVDASSNHRVGIKFDKNIDGHSCNGTCKSGYGYYIENDDIELEINQTIIIHRKDNETIASLKEGKKVIRKTSAKCCPTDTYNFEVGAKLAVSRLPGAPLDSKDTEKVVENGGKFKVGDRVKALVSVGCKSGTKGSLGTIKEIHHKTEATIEFDNDIDGHDARSYIKGGKDLHCWYVGFDDLELVPELSNQFDWESFKSGKFAVHCDTEEKAMEFLKECDANGIKWNSGESTLRSETRYSEYNQDTCYSCYYMGEGRLGYCYSSYYKENNIPVIDYTLSKPTVKEVSRKAEVGEWIKVTNSDGHDNGTGVFKVTNIETNGWVYVNGRNCGVIRNDEYIVLEGCIPEEKPTVKRVKRQAKVGEWIEVVDPDKLDGRTNNGEIYKVYKSDSGTGVMIEHPTLGEVGLWDYEYIVLEGYQPPQETPQPFKKAKVGDKIRVVKVASFHQAEVEIGQIRTVTRVYKDNVTADYNGCVNTMFDEDEEYEIIEEAKPTEKKTPFVAIPQSVIDEVCRWAEPQKKREDEIPCFWDGKRYRDYEKGDKVHVINRVPYENGYALRDYGEIYQVMHDTVVVLFGGVGINMYRKDIELFR